MEIRHSPLPLYPTSPPAQPPARLPTAQEPVPATGAAPERRSGGLTEYIARGEVMEENDSTDYRELIRAARQQRAEAVPGGTAAPGGNSSPYAARALSAYHSNSGGTATGTHAGLDEMV